MADDDIPDDSLTNPLTESATRDAASEYAITFDELDTALAQLQGVLETKLNELYESAWLHGGPQNHLVNDTEGVFFAFVPPQLYRMDGVRQLDLDTETFNAITEAHQNQAAIWKFDVDRPTNYANTFTHDFFPYFIRYPENWRDALYHARLEMMHLLRHDLTPAEALDYWAMHFGPSPLKSNQSRDRWHAYRDVDREATYKTVRQAKEKLADEDHQPHYEEQDIRVTDIED
ncbi:hypothetical protein ACFQGT_00330 [Natrialbaceae archaeon GCM10025810]